MLEDNRERAVGEFNMTRKELEEWLETEESRSVGQGNGESTGHRSGRRIVEILQKNKSDYTDDDVDHMRRVVGYVHRHSAQAPEVEVAQLRRLALLGPPPGSMCERVLYEGCSRSTP